jgi:predicted DNA-binding transcriptional regulator YafY
MFLLTASNIKVHQCVPPAHIFVDLNKFDFMSITKHALIRYQTLDRCFRNTGRRYHIEDLLEECNTALSTFDINTQGIQKRQLYEDIRFMMSEQGWSVPIDKYKEGRTVYYRYDDFSFSINNMPINQTEATQLKSAMLVLSRFKGMPQFEWIEELLPKLDQSFSLSDNSDIIMSFDANRYVHGTEHLSDLFNAIMYKKVINLNYQTFTNVKSTHYVFHPYHLKQHNSRWYLLGQTDGFTTISVLALDRILEIQHIDKAYITNTTDFEEYFEDVIGVTILKGQSLVKIVFETTSLAGNYIKTKPIHGSQKIITDTNEKFIFSLEVIPNMELDKIILGIGEFINVLEPVSYRSHIISRLKRNLELYD